MVLRSTQYSVFCNESKMIVKGLLLLVLLHTSHCCRLQEKTWVYTVTVYIGLLKAAIDIDP